MRIDDSNQELMETSLPFLVWSIAVGLASGAAGYLIGLSNAITESDLTWLVFKNRSAQAFIVMVAAAAVAAYVAGYAMRYEEEEEGELE